MRMGVCEHIPVSCTRTFDFFMFAKVSGRLTNRMGAEKSLSWGEVRSRYPDN